MENQGTKIMDKATYRIIDLFKSTGMGIAPFEKAIHVSEGTIKNLLNHRNNASADLICRVAEYFEVTTDYIMGYTDFPKSPTSWHIFCRMIRKMNVKFETVADGINKPMSFFVDWENGLEPTDIELHVICNFLQLKRNPFEAIKKPSAMERLNANSEILSEEFLKTILANNNGVDWLEKLYGQLKEQRQKAYVILWLVQYLASEGLPVKQILGA